MNYDAQNKTVDLVISSHQDDPKVEQADLTKLHSFLCSVFMKGKRYQFLISCVYITGRFVVVIFQNDRHSPVFNNIEKSSVCKHMS